MYFPNTACTNKCILHIPHCTEIIHYDFSFVKQSESITE